VFGYCFLIHQAAKTCTGPVVKQRPNMLYKTNGLLQKTSKAIKMTSRYTSIFFVFVLAFYVQAGKLSAMELIMFEQDACEWCEIWDAEISGVYPKTREGKAAPLRRVDIFDPQPKDLKDIRRPHFTPTFVLFDNGKEVGRIRGYPGEDFFWGMLAQLIAKGQKSAVDLNKTQSNTKPAS